VQAWAGVLRNQNSNRVWQQPGAPAGPLALLPSAWASITNLAALRSSRGDFFEVKRRREESRSLTGHKMAAKRIVSLGGHALP